MDNSNQKIDFVITWVDGNDKAWQKDKSHYSGKDILKDDRDIRYRDWDLLRFWFRGVEKYAPWVGKIHFVTYGHLPEWLNTNNPQLHIVNHSDYMPKKFLPTFNSNAIELNFHRIDDLSDNFVYFNDDMFPIAPLNQTDFFKNGLPVDMLALQPIIANPLNPTMSHTFLNNSLVISKHFKKRRNMLLHPLNFFNIKYPPLYFIYNILELAFPQFTGLYTVHGAFPLVKSTYKKIWRKERHVLSETSSAHLRSDNDVSIYLIREWQKLSGHFHAENVQKNFKYFNLSNNTSKICKTIEKQSKKIICLNESDKPVNFSKVQHEISSSFIKILPDKSKFEK